MTICYFGIYDPAYSRNRVFITGLRQNGVEVLECTSQKRGIRRYLDLIAKHHQIRNDYDVMVVGFPGQRAAILARCLTRKPIIFDALTSLYDSLVFDRKVIRPRSIGALYVWFLDYLSCRLSDSIVFDTDAHARYFATTFHIPESKCTRIFIGSDDEAVRPLPLKQPSDTFTVHFHGFFNPLQGVRYIVRAAKMLEKEKIAFNVIGRGQNESEIKRLAQELGTTNINFIPPVPYEKLTEYMATADVCLGVFGDSDKTKRVIPNKVFEALAARMPVLTSRTAAIEELLTDKENVLLCESANSEDLAEKILELKHDEQLRRRIAENGYALFLSKLKPVILAKELLEVTEGMKCYLCGSYRSKLLYFGKDRLHKTDTTSFAIRKCPHCGLVYLHPQLSAEELKKYYPPEYGPYQNDANPLKYGPISRALKNFYHRINRSKNTSSDEREKRMEGISVEKSGYYFMDFGCGSGMYLEKMRRLHPDWHISGFDNSETACAQTRAKGFDVRCGDFMMTDFPNNRFDQITMSHVVEHLNDPRAVLAKLNTILKPGGELILSTPNFDSWSEKVFGTYWFALETPRHLFLFDKKTLSRLLKETGFVIDGIEYSNDVRVAIKSLNYLFDRKDMRINFIVWHLFWSAFKPIGNVLALFGKTSIMTLQAKKCS